MTGLLESIDELQEKCGNQKIRLDDRDVKFSPSFVQTLKANLGPDGRNFIVTESTIQWEGKDGLAIVPAALVLLVSILRVSALYTSITRFGPNTVRE